LAGPPTLFQWKLEDRMHLDEQAPVPDLAAAAALGDEELVARVKAGETALYEVLMRRYNQRLYRVARSIVRDEAEAEDVMQQAYVNAYVHLDQFAARARFSTWLTRIAVYEALARVRRRGRLSEIDAMNETEGAAPVLRSPNPDPEQQAMNGELRRTLEQSLDGLPEMYSTIVILRDVEGLSTAEAASCLGTSEEVVKTRLSRARSLLRREILSRAGASARRAFSFHASRCDRVVAGVLQRLQTRALLGVQ
jgi:RNA polymerase sigma-70 factor, ECF subfamily